MGDKFLTDILAQPMQWLQITQFHCENEWKEISAISHQIQLADRIIITGMGASFNASMAWHFLLSKCGKNVSIAETSELLLTYQPRENDLVILLSRSGKSIELIQFIERFGKSDICCASITNDPQSELAVSSNITVDMHTAWDHTISINTYTGLIVVALLIYDYINGSIAKSIDVMKTLCQCAEELIEKSNVFFQNTLWFDGESHYYFLARGAYTSAAYASTLLWEEAAKHPAVYKSTGGFRHGPQEVISPKLKVMIWIENHHLDLDMSLVDNLNRLGVKVIKIGNDPDCEFALANSTNELYSILLSQIPGQLASYHLAIKSKIDPDVFRYCGYIVDQEGGL
jgi:glutamine---fructose-6-phosphate transaminase (isomerizing)